MTGLSWDEMAGAKGTVYAVEAGGGSHELILETVEQLPDSGREGGSFRLEFRGPCEPILPQAIHPFRAGDETVEIFIVPIGRDDKGTRYEAVFF